MSELTQSASESKDILSAVLDEPDYPDSFFLLGKEWTLHREVFPPTLANATEVFSSIIPFPTGGSFLEVGSGTGVISVMAALAGCARVTALDINTKAVENTAVNVARHAVEDKVTVLHSDMYTSLAEGDRFDVIFWNVPWDYVEGDFEMNSDLHRAVFDPAYEGHRAYVAGAAAHLTEGGRLLLGTADLGDISMIRDIAEENGRTATLVRSIRRIEVHRTMEYYLFELEQAR